MTMASCLTPRVSIYPSTDTHTGPILIAVNPFKRLPLYTEDTLLTYFEQARTIGIQSLCSERSQLRTHIISSSHHN